MKNLAHSASLQPLEKIAPPSGHLENGANEEKPAFGRPFRA
jgi:hypothetical protein